MMRVSRRFTTDGKLRGLRSDLLTIRMTQSPKELTLKPFFGSTFSDHMLEIDWRNNYGWKIPYIKPFGAFEIDPSSPCLHSGIQAFDGMKATMDRNEKIHIFRPEKCMQRMNDACEAICFPTFDGDQFLECVYELLRKDRGWFPPEYGSYLYIRPNMIRISEDDVKLYCIAAPVVPFYPKSPPHPISVFTSNKFVRSWIGDVGDKRLGERYRFGIKHQCEATALGYSQMMWLQPKYDGDYVSEIGTMNIFFYWISKEGEKELITPPLNGCIIPGITRDSVLNLCRNWNEFKVLEKEVTIDEIVDAIIENRLMEAFGTGTAVIISPINKIGYQGMDYAIPYSDKPGPVAKKLYETLLLIQLGDKQYDGWSVMVT